MNSIKVCVIGLGPAGIGFTWNLQKSGFNLDDIMCIEAGPSLEKRSCPVLNYGNCINKFPCHIISGFGGSSLMAGGKLSMFPAGAGLEAIVQNSEYLLEKLMEAKSVYESYVSLKNLDLDAAQMDAAKKYYAQYGFEYKHYSAALYDQTEFYNAHKLLQDEFLASNIQIEFNTVVETIQRSEGGFNVVARRNGAVHNFWAEYVVFGGGKFGTRLLQNLKESLLLAPVANKLEIGVRIEFPVEAFDDIDLYHQDLKLKIRNCKTFCISKGGKIVLYLRNGLLYTEGYDNHSAQTEYTNLGFLYSMSTRDYNTENVFSTLEDIRLQNKIFKPIRQNLNDFTSNQVTHTFNYGSSISCWQSEDINAYLPPEIRDNFRQDLLHFIDTFIDATHRNKVSLFYPEVGYGGFKFNVNRSFEVLPNFFIIGESTGQFIGILQSFASGLICSDNFLNDK